MSRKVTRTGKVAEVLYGREMTGATLLCRVWGDEGRDYWINLSAEQIDHLIAMRDKTAPGGVRPAFE